MTHDFNVPFFIPEFSSSKIISHRFHVDNNEGESFISYDMIIGCDLMTKIGPLADFNYIVLQWDGIIVPMKEPSSLLCKTDLTSHEMHEVAMQTEEPVSKEEATEMLVIIMYSTYVKVDPEVLSNNATQLVFEERTLLLRILQYFQDLFDDTLED